MKRSLVLLTALTMIMGLGGCASSADRRPTQEWPEAEKMGFSPALLGEMEKNAATYRINNILIVRNGYKAYHLFNHEDFMKGEENLVPIYSCTKSIISALVGIALDKGYIESVDQKVSEFFPEWEELEPNEMRDSITVEHLLTHTSGWEWPEWTKWNYSITPFTENEDWVRFVLGRSIEARPGTKFNYNSGGSHLLSVIIQRASGMNTLSFARQHLFDPIGIGEVQWPQDPQGYYTGGHGLWMSADDLARFGLLYLSKGKWEDDQIIPEAWVEMSTTRQSEGSMQGGGGEYGYQWWVTALQVGSEQVQVAYALGYAGQFVYIVPEFNMVLVATSQNPGYPFVIRSYMERYILKSLID